MPKLLLNEEIKKEIELYGYSLCGEYEKLQANKRENVIDKNGYKYFLSLKGIRNLNGNTPYRFRLTNPYTKENIENWINIENKNFILIDDVYINNTAPLKFKCTKEDCEMNFEKQWSDILQGHGCPYCSHQKLKYEFSLAFVNPEIAELWDYEKNYPLTPNDVFSKTPKNYWWRCKNDSSHNYLGQVGNRVNGFGCPQCYGMVAGEVNNLLVHNPELCEEWDYELNTKSPSEYTPFSSKKVHWICKKCGNKWKSGIGSRNHENGCPKCASSKGEEKIRKILISKNINFTEQYTIKECRNIYPLPFDFAILKEGCLLMLIEYDGEFHYKESRFKNGKQLENVQCRDKIKTDFCKINNINLLRIPYWEYKNVEQILHKEIELGG